jgi:general secretion pathway protein C
MHLDETLKRAFPALLFLPIPLIAYFQGSGVAFIVAEDLLPVDAADLEPPQRPPLPPARPTPPTARAILDHNPFDHETDLSPPPVTGAPVAPAAPAAATQLDVSDPLHAEPCEGLSVEIVSEANNPEESIAVLQPKDEKSGTARQVGDSIGDFQVEYIGFNRLERSPAVWLSEGNTLCQTLLFAEEPDPKAAKKPSKSAPKPPAPKAKPKPKAKVPDEIASRIEKVSDLEYNVDRSVVDEVLENKASLMRGTRMVPEKGKGGGNVGIRLFGVRPSSLLSTVGLKNGDRIDKINGFDITDPQKALQAYARLRMADHLDIEITRRGKPETIQLKLK